MSGSRRIGPASASGSSGHVYSQAYAASTSSNAASAATKGSGLTPIVTFSIDTVYWEVVTVDTHVYNCTVLLVNSSGTVQTAGVLANVNVTASGSVRQWLTFSLGSLVSLAAGSNYIIAITDTSAASSTTTITVRLGSGSPAWYGLPVDPIANVGSQGWSLAKKTTPAVGDSFSSTINGASAMLRAVV